MSGGVASIEEFDIIMDDDDEIPFISDNNSEEFLSLLLDEDNEMPTEQWNAIHDLDDIVMVVEEEEEEGDEEMPFISGVSLEELQSLLLNDVEPLLVSRFGLGNKRAAHQELMKVEDSSSMVQHCVICLEEFSKGSEVARLPCSHEYHEPCIVQWLEKSNHCPLCRYKMPS